MASPNTTFTEMVTTTLRNHPDAVYDNVSNHNALFSRLRRRGKIKRINGGYEIVRALDYAENSTFQWYDGYEVLNVGQSEVLSAAKFDWKQAAVNVVASGKELRMNNGREQIIDLAEARTKNAMRTMSNQLSNGIYSDGTGSDSKEIGGLDLLIQTNGNGTVGGIDASANTFWQNQFKDGGTITTTSIKGDMNELWLDCVRGADKPDLIVSSNEIFNTYWNSLQDLQRYASADEGFGWVHLAQVRDCRRDPRWRFRHHCKSHVLPEHRLSRTRGSPRRRHDGPGGQGVIQSGRGCDSAPVHGQSLREQSCSAGRAVHLGGLTNGEH